MHSPGDLIVTNKTKNKQTNKQINKQTNKPNLSYGWRQMGLSYPWNSIDSFKIQLNIVRLVVCLVMWPQSKEKKNEFYEF